MKPWVINLTRSVVVFGVLALIIELLLLWTGLSPAAFARPSEIIFELPKFVDPAHNLEDVLTTVKRTLGAFLIATPVGLVTGVLVVKAKWIRGQAEFMVDFLRSIPATALIPLFMVFFGPQGASKVAIGAFSGALVIALSVIVGYRNLDKDRVQVANLLRLKGSRRTWLYEFPEISPSLVVGARTSVSLCLVLVVVAEMFIGSGSGLGYVIQDRRYSDGVPEVYAAILVTGVVGFTFNSIFQGIETRLRRNGGRLS